MHEGFYTKITETSEEIKALLEVDFGYVCEKDGPTYFRKRKQIEMKKSK